MSRKEQIRNAYKLTGDNASFYDGMMTYSTFLGKAICRLLPLYKATGISLLLMIGAFIYGGYDGIRNSFAFWQFFLRFIIMLYLWKAFDIICLDWYLLTKSHFFQRYYPETEGCEGYHQFGFNRKGQLTRIIVFPFVAALMAGIAVWIRG